MKFTVAASILVQALPTVSEERTRRGRLAKLVGVPKNTEYELNIIDTANEETRAGTRIRGFGFRTRGNSSNNNKSSDGARLMNLKFLKPKNSNVTASRQECDPKQTSEYSKADVGILACGDNQYCMESGYSKLGGFCVTDDDNKGWDEMDQTSQRMLQSNSTGSSYSCEATYTSTTLILSCPNYESGCLPPCNTTCFNLSYTLTSFINASDYDLHFCYDIYGTYTTNFCYNYTVTDSRPSCSLTYFDQDCAVCIIDGNCSLFDCTNVQGPYGQGTYGNTCNNDFPPPFWEDTLRSCYCDICSGGDITDTQGTVPYLNISCGFAEYLASLSPLPENTCDTIQAIAFDACGCEGGTPPFVCTACPDGRTVTNPDTVLDLSSFGMNDTTCEEIELYALYLAPYYGIDAAICPAFQSLIDESCGCRSSYVCPVCPNGQLIGHPNAVVDLTGVGFGIPICVELELYASHYNVDATTCPFFQSLIADPCGCHTPIIPSSSTPATAAPMMPTARKITQQKHTTGVAGPTNVAPVPRSDSSGLLSLTLAGAVTTAVATFLSG